ncbi:helix-turn-helix transcriptional regulator [Streptomyces sp. RKCA744]|uniref:helix-turn-helix domain-containing protein n=1 Tax=Streptomyces sp. RKCA744 TaxID=2959340 RepID=UPI00209E0DFD|nr:helix-turn-helix transcriptional regulator [Streptomyces sp. RKCA744]MCO8305222.1 helix-turn-helix domain-containing protein [Streptomyces sp. RKCA744]
MTFDPEQLGQSKADLAETLRTLRKRANRTQVWLAQRCNISPTKLSNLETGRITSKYRRQGPHRLKLLRDREKACHALGVCSTAECVPDRRGTRAAPAE